MFPDELLYPCWFCGEDVHVQLVRDDADKGWRSVNFIDVVNAHVSSVHGVEMSGRAAPTPRGLERPSVTEIA